MVRKLVVLASLLIFTGCESYEHTEYVEPANVLDSSLGVLISIPEDGVFGPHNYRNSGRMTANAIRKAFMTHTATVTIIEDCHGHECLDGVDGTRYGYYVQPEILHWEDRATEWSGKSDRLEVQVTVYDTSTKSEIVSSSYKGKSQWLTLGGDHPQDLLPKPTEEFIASLYGVLEG